MAENTLVVTRINKSLGRKQSKIMTVELKEESKGIKQILKKCYLWPDGGVNLICKCCSEKIKDD
ncbi:15159_t:CDS:2 [Cetraspora pellucida]|uniref:15159_t:CDS:1 n=1 Tax=Cetraspora pellucida TaxID=1433469 RepID=A0A9N9JNY5_9GLOM|nr:15159_t:CDS:2 [Cetraspora pellucida]